MWICTECGTTYEDDRRPYYEEKEPYGDTYAVFREYVCHCGGELEEAAECKGCGKVHALCDLEDGFCGECGGQLIRDAQYVLKEHFSPDEFEFLRWHMEGVL